MIIDLEKYSLDGKFYDYKDGEQKAELKIRPFPRSLNKMTFSRDGSVIVTGQENLETFDYCLMEWKNVVDVNKKEIKLTSEVKKQLFDRGHDIVNFVLKTNAEILSQVDEQLKN